MKNLFTLCMSLFLLCTIVGCSDDDSVGADGNSSSGIQGIWLLSSVRYTDNDYPSDNYYEEFSLTDTTKCLATELLVLTDNDECIIIQCNQSGSSLDDYESSYSCAGDYLCYRRSAYDERYAQYSISGSTLTLTERDSYGYTTVNTYSRYSGEIKPSVWNDVYNNEISFKIFYPRN